MLEEALTVVGGRTFQDGGFLGSQGRGCQKCQAKEKDWQEPTANDRGQVYPGKMSGEILLRNPYFQGRIYEI